MYSANVTLVAAFLSLAACTASGTSPSGGGGPSASGSGSGSGHGFIATPSDFAGAWILCDTGSELNPSWQDYIPYGGVPLSVSAQGNALSATTSGGDGGAVQIMDGPLDMSTRTWTTGVDMSEGSPGGGSGMATITFSADGTRFDGAFHAQYETNGVLYGGRADGSFTCESGLSAISDAGLSHQSCTGTARSCSSFSPPNCPIGCEMQIGYDGYDTCQGGAGPCDAISSPSLCRQLGCTWHP
jgi:hypothetical protein